MHVRYLQHHSHGTVQLLMMPLSAAVAANESFAEAKSGPDEEAECEPIPLPIQSFLWRQTHPFLGARVSKLQDASCVTFERVIVQNILHGISPSLSDAIGSISRWNMVRASFPHIVQCCAALLGERAAEEEGLAMSGSLVKMLYILHWLLIDAAVECNENTLNSDNPCAPLSVRQLTYSVSSVQLFVYLLAPLFNIVQEEEIEGHIRLESGLRLWQALWQQRLPELLSFSAPVRQRRSMLPQLNSTPWAKRAQSMAAEQGIYLGDSPSGILAPPGGTVGARRASQVPPGSAQPSSTHSSSVSPFPFPPVNAAALPPIPPPKPPRTDVNVLKELEAKKQQQQQLEGAKTPGIVRSVSDYKTEFVAEQSRAAIQGSLCKSRTTGFQGSSTSGEEERSPDSPTTGDGCSGIRKMEEMFAQQDEDGFSAFDPSLNGNGQAPLVRLQDICSSASIDAESIAGEREAEDGGKGEQAQREPEQTITPSATMASRPIPKTLICHPSGEGDSSSMASQQTVISRPPLAPILVTSQSAISTPNAPPKISLSARTDSEQSGGGEKLDTPSPASLDPHEANYMDVAVLRCLLIRNWAEEGVFWSAKYLLNRLVAMRQYRCAHEGAFRSRCNSDSAAIPTRKTSKNEAANLDFKGYLTWADLQDRTDAISKKLAERQRELADPDTARRGVAFEAGVGTVLVVPGEQKGSSPRDKERRRISVNTLPSKTPKNGGASARRVERAHSVPASFPRLGELFLGIPPKEPSSGYSPQQQQDERDREAQKSSHFFPEAIGSTSFIERNGHLSLPIVLKTLGTLMERCTVVRVSEVVLNICDTLLNMPGADTSVFMAGLLHIAHRVCVQLGCPNGCNEGIRTPQAEFLRIKVRNLLVQMHRISPKQLCSLLCEQVAQSPCVQIVDALHSLTVFCQSESSVASQQRTRLFSLKDGGRRSSSGGSGSRRPSPYDRTPTYKNNFNEKQSGIEGVLIGSTLGPLLDKLAASAQELSQPENMSYSQDVRVLVAYAFARHGNPLRRCALSAMAAKTLSSSVQQQQNGTCAGRQQQQAKSSVATSPTPVLAPPTREGAASLRRGLFRRMQSTTMANEPTATITTVESDGGAGSTQSTPPPMLIPSTSVDESIGSPQQQTIGSTGSGVKKSRSAQRSGGGRLQFALSLLKGRTGAGSEPANSEEDDGSSNAADEPADEEDGSQGGSSIDAGSGRLRQIGFRPSGGGISLQSGSGGRLVAPKHQFGFECAEDGAGKPELLAPAFLPQQRLVQVKELRAGAARFAFLLENSRPGTFPDAPLVAALPELKSPALARAVLLLECAHHVSRCNRGDWPDWIRSGMFFSNQIRSLGGGGGSIISPPTPSLHPQSSVRVGSGGGASRRTALLQRAAGRAFYAWAQQLGTRLQKQIDAEKEAKSATEKTERRQLKLQDELEDFLDDGTVNWQGGETAIPVALQMLVCVLLQQITAFLRETFQTLPRVRNSQKNVTSAVATGWERLQSHRRWSILSNTFNPQLQQLAQQQPLGSGSIHSIDELHPSCLSERRVSYSTADGDEENSPRGSHDMGGEEQLPLSHVEKGKDRVPIPSSTSLSSTLRRFASRTRLFSRTETQHLYASVAQQESSGEEQHSPQQLAVEEDAHSGVKADDERPLMGQDWRKRSARKSSSPRKSVRRLAQGRQRLLKRRSPQGGAVPTPPQSAPPAAQQPPELPSTGSAKKRESIRIRKTSRQAQPPPVSTIIPMEPEWNAETGPGESAPLMRRSTADEGVLPPQQQRVVSFVQRRRRTASFKSRVTRPQATGGGVTARHSMRVARAVTADESEDLLSTAAESQQGLVSAPITPAQQTQPRSPVFMLSIARKANPAGRLRADQLQQQHFQQPSPERLSSSTIVSHQQQREQQMEAEEEESEEDMFKTMPWLGTMLEFVQRFDFQCTHESFCTKWCFDRIYRQCNRLVEALLVVYGQSPTEGRVDRRQQFIERWQSSQQKEFKKRHSSNPPRRESANVRQSGVDRMPLALRGLIFEKLNEIEENRAKKAEETDTQIDSKELRAKRPPPIAGFLCVNVLKIAHAPLSALLKGIVVLKGEQLVPAVGIAWKLLLNSDDSNLVATAAALFICCAVKCPQECTNLMNAELSSADPSTRTAAVRRFFVLWRQRYHVWLKMEDGAQLIFKVPPPSIDFTLPSPSIGQSQIPVVDPPWLPPVKTKVEELSLKEEEQSTSQTIMTMTRTRRKQKQEMVRKAVRKAEERQRELREQFPLRATAIVQQVAYEPALFQHQLTAMAENVQGADESVQPEHRQMVVPVAQPLFPSSILSVVPTIVELSDDPQVDSSGVSVGETCRRVIWSCLVEDTALFLRHFFEKFTNRGRQEYLIALLRRLVLSLRPLPSQTAHTILNALFGLVMFYVRTPCEGSDRSLALALSLCWLVVPYVHGLYFKDLKQTLKKEQCDQAIMVTANVPSAKKVVVHGPDSNQGGIPTQFPVLEETQFQHLLADSIEFYNIEAEEADDHFLYDPKTFVLHNPNAYVRDFYFFHRSFYPQLQLVHLNAQVAQQRIREHALQQKLIETGKVLLTHNALRFSPEAVVPQRIFFLHDELTHLPSFPRRAVESCFGMYQGPAGEELQEMDALHKFAWSKLMANMFEKMENVFMFGDLHLFINVINGVMIIHCEDVLILRRCMAAYLGMCIHFNSLFASQGFSLIMPTILRCYSQRQPNRLFTQVVEFVCKQFYILHRKPFLLQMFGSVADLLDQNDNDLEANPMRVKAKYMFSLLLAMERTLDPPDQLDILAMLPYPKPLQALDLCYKDEPNTFNILTDAMASCVTICAFAPESRRSHQMLLCMQSMLPHLIRHMEEEATIRQANSPAALKLELSALATLCVEMRALINSSDVLARGPTRSFDLAGASTTANTAMGAPNANNYEFNRGRSFAAGGADSPQFFDPPTIAEDENTGRQQNQRGGESHSSSAKPEKKLTGSGWAEAATDNEALKEQFRGPRDALLALCSMFVRRGSARIKELSRLGAVLEHTRIPELVDHKCHVKLSEVAVALLKLAPYDAATLGCSGLRQYFVHVLPVVDWSVETNRSAVNVILRRLDKTIAKLAKRPSARRRANWGAISCWLGGLHQTLLNSPYIAHLHSLKTITLLCIRLTLGDPLGGPIDEQPNPQQLGHHLTAGAFAPQTVLSPHTTPASLCSVVLKLASFLMTALGQFVFSLELICTTESLGPLADRPEALLCQFLIPLFLRSAIPEAPQFRAKDINFCLNVLQNAVSPPSSCKQSVAPAMSGSSLALRDNSGRQGSVSVTERGGYSATVSTARIVRESVVQTVMLALKVIVLSFYKQLTVAQWMRIGRIVREIVAKKGGGAALSPFLKFMLSANLPIAEVLQIIVLNKLNQRPAGEVDVAWLAELRDRLARAKLEPVRKGHFVQLRALHKELQQLKEEFTTRNLEIPRSRTPTIGGELHSDSGSSQGALVQRESTTRRLSSTALGKLRWIQSKGSTAGVDAAVGPKGSGGAAPMQDATIMEDAAEEENSPEGGVARVSKSPSLPFSRTSMRAGERRSLGMFRSVRKTPAGRPTATRLGSVESSRVGGVELQEVGSSTAGTSGSTTSFSSRRSSSLKKFTSHRTVAEEDHGHPAEEGDTATPSQTSFTRLGSEAERPRVVSFSTPRHSSVSQTISEADSEAEQFCITSTKHLI